MGQVIAHNPQMACLAGAAVSDARYQIIGRGTLESDEGDGLLVDFMKNRLLREEFMLTETGVPEMRKKRVNTQIYAAYKDSKPLFKAAADKYNVNRGKREEAAIVRELRNSRSSLAEAEDMQDFFLDRAYHAVEQAPEAQKPALEEAFFGDGDE